VGVNAARPLLRVAAAVLAAEIPYRTGLLDERHRGLHEGG